MREREGKREREMVVTGRGLACEMRAHREKRSGGREGEVSRGETCSA